MCATFTPSWLEDNGHRIGQLVIKGDGKDIMDIIVFTALVVQERTDEYKASVIPHATPSNGALGRKGQTKCDGKWVCYVLSQRGLSFEMSSDN